MPKYSAGRNKHSPSHRLFNQRELAWSALTSGALPAETLLGSAEMLGTTLGLVAQGLARNQPHTKRRSLERSAEAARRQAVRAETNGESINFVAKLAIDESMAWRPETEDLTELDSAVQPRALVLEEEDVA